MCYEKHMKSIGVPMPAHTTLEALEAAGRLVRARPTRADALMVKPIAAKKGIPLPSEILARIRADER